MRARDQSVAVAVHQEPGRGGVHALQLGVQRAHGRAVVEGHGEPARPGTGHADPVAGAAQFEVDGAAARVPHLRPSAVGGGEQVPALGLLGLLVGLDRRGGERDARVPRIAQPPLLAHAVDPAGVGARVDDLLGVEQVEQEALVGRTSLDQHTGLRHRAAQPRQRLGAVTAVRDDLGDHRVEVGGDRVSLGDTGVDPHTGPRGQPQQGDPARRGGEIAVGVLGVEPGLDGVAEFGGPFAVERAASSDVQLCLDQVHPGGGLGDGVLHLQPRVHLEEREQPLTRVVEELDGGRAPVPHRQGQPLGGGLELVRLLGIQQW